MDTIIAFIFDKVTYILADDVLRPLSHEFPAILIGRQDITIFAYRIDQVIGRLYQRAISFLRTSKLPGIVLQVLRLFFDLVLKGSQPGPFVCGEKGY